MTNKKQKFIPGSLVGKTLDYALSIIYSDIDHTGTTKFYWLSVPQNIENQEHFIRFPYGTEFYMQHDNGIITKIY